MCPRTSRGPFRSGIIILAHCCAPCCGRSSGSLRQDDDRRSGKSTGWRRFLLARPPPGRLRGRSPGWPIGPVGEPPHRRRPVRNTGRHLPAGQRGQARGGVLAQPGCERPSYTAPVSTPHTSGQHVSERRRRTLRRRRRTVLVGGVLAVVVVVLVVVNVGSTPGPSGRATNTTSSAAGTSTTGTSTGHGNTETSVTSSPAAIGTRAAGHGGLSAVESGVLPWTLAQPLSREVVVPGLVPGLGSGSGSGSGAASSSWGA